MSNKPFYIAFRIYLIALFLNTMVGTIMMVTRYELIGYVHVMLGFGTVLGALVSLPALPIMYLLISFGKTWRVPTGKLFIAALIVAAALSVTAWVLYVECFHGHYTDEGYLVLALFSGLTATASQFRSFQEVTEYEQINTWETI